MEREESLLKITELWQYKRRHLNHERMDEEWRAKHEALDVMGITDTLHMRELDSKESCTKSKGI